MSIRECAVWRSALVLAIRTCSTSMLARRITHEFKFASICIRSCGYAWFWRVADRLLISSTIASRSPESRINEPTLSLYDKKEALMKYCENCGAELQDDASFCSRCGVKVAPQTNETTVGAYGATPPENDTAVNWYSSDDSGKGNSGDGFATASLVLGILSLFLGFIPGILAIVFASSAETKGTDKRGYATAGRVMGIISIVLCGVIIVIGLLVYGVTLATLPSYVNELYY